MSSSANLLDTLIASLRILPGVGPKSAQRMAYYLLAHNRQGGTQLAEQLQQAMSRIQYCQQCRNFTDESICQLCQNTKREQNSLCIVESPADVNAMEQTHYRGLYFVLHGHLSPIDGIGPEQLGLSQLVEHVKQHDNIKEIIIATNPTVEGNTTAHYIANLLKPYPCQCTRLAHGVPIGGELEYIDGTTLNHALTGREQL